MIDDLRVDCIIDDRFNAPLIRIIDPIIRSSMAKSMNTSSIIDPQIN